MSEIETEIKKITAKDFAKLDFATATVLDLREPDEVLVKGIDGAINVPFSKIGKGLDAVPKDKTVYVICRTGDFSEEVTEILTDRGYDAYDVEGGYNAFAEAIKNAPPISIDAKGLKCPGPIVKVADTKKSCTTVSVFTLRQQRTLFIPTSRCGATERATSCLT